MKEENRKTTIEIPADLHRRARIRAAETDTDFRTIVIRALEEYLAKAVRKGGKT
jgi:hypothetical protein